jgi:hypothetical protein
MLNELLEPHEMPQHLLDVQQKRIWKQKRTLKHLPHEMQRRMLNELLEPHEMLRHLLV